MDIEASKPLLVYNYYNLDPNWRKEQDVNRVLLLEPSVFQQYPVSENVLRFMLNLAQNIEGMQLYVGEFEQLKKETDTASKDRLVDLETELDDLEAKSADLTAVWQAEKEKLAG